QALRKTMANWTATAHSRGVQARPCRVRATSWGVNSRDRAKRNRSDPAALSTITNYMKRDTHQMVSERENPAGLAHSLCVFCAGAGQTDIKNGRGDWIR